MRIEIGIRGTNPEPQGSKSAVVRGGKAVVLEGKSSSSRKRYADWRKKIRAKADDVHPGEPLDEAVAVSILFLMPRPGAHYRSRNRIPYVRDDAPIFHTNKPDVDKLARAVLDALTGHVLEDDSNVAILNCRKVYVAKADAGAVITIATMPNDRPTIEEEA
jgi:Holliday junction resolvase RusA-like endonuclease